MRWKMKILMVLTSHDKLGDTGKKTGFWLEELAAPYFHFKDNGVDLVLASPKGGQPPLDPKSNEPASQTDETRRFEADSEAMGVALGEVGVEPFELVDAQFTDADARGDLELGTPGGEKRGARDLRQGHADGNRDPCLARRWRGGSSCRWQLL